jgi:hypothetical protein
MCPVRIEDLFVSFLFRELTIVCVGIIPNMDNLINVSHVYYIYGTQSACGLATAGGCTPAGHYRALLDDYAFVLLLVHPVVLPYRNCRES